jgi:hypothetical protein
MLVVRDVYSCDPGHAFIRLCVVNETGNYSVKFDR